MLPVARASRGQGSTMKLKKVLLLGAVVMSCAASAAETQSADERLRAIYTEEWKWRLEQFSGLGGIIKANPSRPSTKNPSTHEMRLRYWCGRAAKLREISR